MTHLSVRDLCLRLGGRVFLDSIGLELEPGSFTGLVGPNGSGKSSLLKSIYRVLRPASGAVLIDGDDVASLRPRAAARAMAVLAQDTPVDAELTVLEMVMLGRIPHQHALRGADDRDLAAVRRSLRLVGAEHLAARPWQTLSGGERQRAALARALAQEAPLLILDEPTNHLDIRHQLELLEIVRASGISTLAALHDLNLAAHFCDHLVVVDEGRVVAHGPPEAVLVAEVITPVFGVEVDRVTHPRTGAPSLLFTPRRPAAHSGAPVPRTLSETH